MGEEMNHRLLMLKKSKSALVLPLQQLVDPLDYDDDS